MIGWRFALRAIGAALLVMLAAISLLYAFEAPQIPVMVERLISVILIAAAIVDWWAVLVVHRLMMKARNQGSLGTVPLRAQLERFVITASAYTFIGLLGLNFLLGMFLKPGVGFIFLAVGVTLGSVPPVYWLFRYYRN